MDALGPQYKETNPSIQSPYRYISTPRSPWNIAQREIKAPQSLSRLKKKVVRRHKLRRKWHQTIKLPSKTKQKLLLELLNKLNLQKLRSQVEIKLL
jgi:hypothetical protein